MQKAELTALADFSVTTRPGNERQAMEQVARLAAALGSPPAQVERIKTAVAETILNAMEHGNHYDPVLAVQIQVLKSSSNLLVRVTDQGSGQPVSASVEPDLEAKLAGLQSPRGWGWFLIKNMVDEMNVVEDNGHHTVELIFHLAANVP